MANVRTSEQLARINPDSKAVLYLVLTVTTVIAAVAFAVSFAGLAAVSEWAQIPPRLSWALPVFIDGAILGFTIMILVFRARGESTVFAWIVLIAFTVISVGANAAHAYAEGAPEDWRTIVGSGLAGLAPAGLAVFIHGIARLLVAPPQADHAVSHVEAQGDKDTSGPSDDGPGGGEALPQTPVVENGSLELDPFEHLEPFVEPAEPEVPVPAKVETVQAPDLAPEPFVETDIEAPGRGVPDASVKTPTADPAPASVPPTTPVSGEVSREEQIEEVLALHAKGKTQQEIAEVVGVSRATVGRWIKTHREDIAARKHLRALS